MAERPVSLDLRMPAGQAQGDRAGGMPGGAARQQADPEAAARFAQRLRSSPESANASSSPSSASPFSLFGQTASVEGAQGSVASSADPGEAVAAVWDRALQNGVKRLMVAEDQRSLRLDLDASVFPGVIVEVFEDAGAWVAQFTCSEQSSFDRLAAAAQEMASRMADTLERDALWRVLAEGGPIAAQSVEAFCSAPGGGLR